MTPISSDSATRTILGYARLFDAPGQAVIATRADGSIIYWSNGAAALYGWDEEEVLGLDVLQITPSASARAHADSIMTNLRGGQSWSGSLRVQRRDGTELVVNVRDLPVRDENGALLGVVGVSSPATEHPSRESRSISSP
ncbi:hypothetical protein BH23GEM6_BH23GEM6_19440 [soil metagenome]